jgi:beta-mannanase
MLVNVQSENTIRLLKRYIVHSSHSFYDILSNKCLDPTRLQWIWSISKVDVGQYTAEEYWVGENYVDWLEIDGYNPDASQT